MAVLILLVDIDIDYFKNRTFKEEKEHMKGRGVFTSFYEQLKEVRTFHRKYPNTVVSHEPNLNKALNPQVKVYTTNIQ